MPLFQGLGLCGGVEACSEQTCISISPEEDADSFGIPSGPLAVAYQKVQNSLKASTLCGGNPVELAKRGSGRARRLKQASSKAFGSTNAPGSHINFDPKLPKLEESYIVTGVQLGMLRQAIHRESRQKRAILRIPKSKVPQGSTDDVAKEIRNRLETLLKIDHVNVLALHEACEDHRFIHLVYDWPDGGLLLDFLTRSSEDVTEAHLSSVAREVLSAVAAANRFNVHHLDWSLLSVFLGYKDRFTPVKVFGFGLAGLLVPLVTSRLRSRTVSRSNKHFYASPELLVESNHRAMPQQKLHVCDIWSVGTLVYMLVSGRPPFYGRADEVVNQIRRAHFSFGYEFDSISREAKDGIEKMLTKKWEIRPPAVDLLKHPFMQLQVTGRRKEGVICQDALTKLNEFAQETHCKQTLARLLADLGLQESQYSDLEDRFRQLDLDGNGVIEVSELCEVAQSLPDGKDSEAIAKTIAEIVRHCDRNDNSTVDISEFVAAVVLKLEQKDERLLVKAFDKMDINGDARITKGELFRVLRQYSDNLMPEDVATFVKEMDDDLDQKIDYVEFKDLFRNTKDRDEEVKMKMREARMHFQESQKAFDHFQNEVQKFFISLKTHACMLAMEYERMRKPNAGYEVEQSIATKVKALIEVVRGFAGRTNQEDAARVKAESEKRERSTLTGLTVMNRYNKGEGEGPDPSAEEAAASDGNPSGQESGGSDNEHRNFKHRTSMVGGAGGRTSMVGGASGRTSIMGGAGGGISMMGGSVEAAATGGEHDHHNKLSIAEEYLMRSNKELAGKVFTEVQKEANRRRRYLWLGGGDGVQNLRTGFLGKGEGLRSSMVLRRRTRTSVQNTSSEAKEDEDSGDDEESEVESSRNRRSGRTTTLQSFAAGDVDSDNEDGDNTKLIPWNPTKKLKGGSAIRWSKECMILSQGPQMEGAGSIEPEAMPQALSRLAKRFLDEYLLHQDVSKELCDLSKLMRYKCAKSWLPRLQIWVTELKASLDQQRVHIVQRKNIHMNCIKHVLQTCERIMFSLAEFVVWQEEAFYASWSTENMVQQPPASKRFLPHRGDVDEDARTPRDEDDAMALAPEEGEHMGGQTMGSMAEGLDETRDVVFAESNAALSQAEPFSQDPSASVTGAALSHGGQRSKKLDRVFVRSRTAKDARAVGKLRSLAEEGAKQAAMTHSMSMAF